MPKKRKPGTEYEDFVASVVQVFDPGVTVKSGQWMEGPDGQLDMDVLVKAFCINGKLGRDVVKFK